MNFNINSTLQIEFVSSLENGRVLSLLKFTNNNDSISVNYEFDINIDHWKLLQANKVILKSNELISKNITFDTLVELTNALEMFYKENHQILIENKDPLLISLINYYTSIFNTAANSILNGENCKCTVHPAFLIGKTYFNCQEEQFFSVMKLKEIINEYRVNNEMDSSTVNLIYYLNHTNQEQIRFDDFYSYYISKEDYELLLSNFLNSQKSSEESSQELERGSSGWWCVLGCGSDHGCCGNYSGCCLYRHIICFIHDNYCTNCEPVIVCGPYCKPDNPDTGMD